MRSVTRLVKGLHERGEIRITGWKRNLGGGPSVPVYTAGPGLNRTCTLHYRTGAEWSKLTRERAKKSGQHEINAAKKRAQRKLKTMITQRVKATWWSALEIAA